MILTAGVGLCVLCVFQCAASMGVGVGAFSDPEGLEGLAHFLGIIFAFEFFSFSFFNLSSCS